MPLVYLNNCFSFSQVYASGTEDMDALTFGSSVLLRHLTFSEARSVSLLNLMFCHAKRYLLLFGFVSCCFFILKQ